MEKEHRVIQRWKVGDSAYDQFVQTRNLRKCKLLFEDVQSTARQQWFMLLIKAKFAGETLYCNRIIMNLTYIIILYIVLTADGHNMTSKISANITTTTKRLKNIISKYTCCSWYKYKY